MWIPLFQFVILYDGPGTHVKAAGMSAMLRFVDPSAKRADDIDKLLQSKLFKDNRVY